MNKKIVFLSGTRADYGKLKSLIHICSASDKFNVSMFVTGMHLQKQFGYTVNEILKSGFTNIHTYENHTSSSSMDLTLAKTIQGLSEYVKKEKPDLLIVHGDRVEALAGAIVGSLNNILVGHIEGGEVSGTIDELIRHSVSKLSHLHFVANEDAKNRLLQMGEIESSIHIIGSPDVDVMFSKDLPSIQQVKEHYDILFEKYGLMMFHPVTTEQSDIPTQINNLVECVKNDQNNYVVIYPNNDSGSEVIIKAIDKLKSNSKFKIFPSVRFESFLVLLKNSSFIIGNSSAGVREAPYYGIPSIDIGNRQNNRAKSNSIIHVDYDQDSIRNGIAKAQNLDIKTPDQLFGIGKSNELFFELIIDNNIWKTPHQKVFNDI